MIKVFLKKPDTHCRHYFIFWQELFYYMFFQLWKRMEFRWREVWVVWWRYERVNQRQLIFSVFRALVWELARSCWRKTWYISWEKCNWVHDDTLRHVPLTLQRSNKALSLLWCQYARTSNALRCMYIVESREHHFASTKCGFELHRSDGHLWRYSTDGLLFQARSNTHLLSAVTVPHKNPSPPCLHCTASCRQASIRFYFISSVAMQ